MLSNGMEVVVIPDHRAPIVRQMVWYKAGNADEPPSKSGIAHFLEHLMFERTKKHPAGKLPARSAMRRTASRLPTTPPTIRWFRRRALGTMMEFEADRMRHLVLTDAVVASERDVFQRGADAGDPRASIETPLGVEPSSVKPHRLELLVKMAHGSMLPFRRSQRPTTGRATVTATWPKVRLTTYRRIGRRLHDGKEDFFSNRCDRRQQSGAFDQAARNPINRLIRCTFAKRIFELGAGPGLVSSMAVPASAAIF
ncbi:M16 family metallopeptidase [Sinorhizobium garamanticum]|uniref:M16 family metallopeptidase n=1 Tax=Sinorhizobium garamanticum TaxID=680247 RepID=UPI003145561B